jgi:ComEC/Rec2-related protein
MREELEARPSAIAFVALVLGLICSTLWVAGILTIGLAVWMRGLPRKWIVAAGFIVGIALSPQLPLRLTEPRFIEGTATVVSVPTLALEAQTCEIRVNDVLLVAVLPPTPTVMIGDELKVRGDAQPIGTSRPEFDPVIGRIRIREMVDLSKGPWIAGIADAWRRSLSEFLTLSLGSSGGALADSMCFGGRASLDVTTKSDLIASGLIHLVSISGVQVFAVAGLVFLWLRLLPLSRASQILILGSILLLYTLAAGMQPQFIRAVAMVLLSYGAFLFGRDPDSLSALCLSGTVILLWKPESVFGIGFQLSFMVAAAFSLFYHTRSEMKSDWKQIFLKRVREFTSASAVVALSAYPLVAYGIGVISLGGLIANFLVFWSVPLIICGSFLSHGLWLVSPPVGEGAAIYVLRPLCSWIIGCAQMGSFRIGSIAVPGFSGYWLVLYYGAWALAYRRRVVHP